MKTLPIILFLLIIPSICFSGSPALLKHDITRTMEVKTKEGSLSPLTFISGEKAFITIYSSISGLDEVGIWRDLQILNLMPEITEIVVYLNSLGGTADSGFAIGDQFKRVKDRFKLSVYASGTVASAAVIVFASFDQRFASPCTYFMVHELRASDDSMRGLPASQIKVMDDLFDKYAEMYVEILTSTTKVSREEWQQMMKQTTWFRADRAFEWGLVTEVK